MIHMSLFLPGYACDIQYHFAQKKLSPAYMYLFKFCKRKMMFIGFCDIWLSIKESLASISIKVSVEPHL